MGGACSGAAIAASVLAQAFLPGLLGFALWLLLLAKAPNAKRGFWLGLAFGYGWHLVGLYWVGIAFFADAERFGALAVPGVLLLVLANALFVAATGFLVTLRRWRSPLAMAG